MSVPGGSSTSGRQNWLWLRALGNLASTGCVALAKPLTLSETWILLCAVLSHGECSVTGVRASPPAQGWDGLAAHRDPCPGDACLAWRCLCSPCEVTGAAEAELLGPEHLQSEALAPPGFQTQPSPLWAAVGRVSLCAPCTARSSAWMPCAWGAQGHCGSWPGAAHGSRWRAPSEGRAGIQVPAPFPADSGLQTRSEPIGGGRSAGPIPQPLAPVCSGCPRGHRGFGERVRCDGAERLTLQMRGHHPVGACSLPEEQPFSRVLWLLPGDSVLCRAALHLRVLLLLHKGSQAAQGPAPGPSHCSLEMGPLRCQEQPGSPSDCPVSHVRVEHRSPSPLDSTISLQPLLPQGCGRGDPVHSPCLWKPAVPEPGSAGRQDQRDMSKKSKIGQ